jgi:hypothetical protein
MEFVLLLQREWESDLPMLKEMVDIELLLAMVSLGLPLDMLELEATADLLAGTSMLAPDISPISSRVLGITSSLKGACTESEVLSATSFFLKDDPSSYNLFISNPTDSSPTR